MKKLLIIVLCAALHLLFWCTAHAQYNWHLLPDSPQNGQKQDDIFFINARLGWAVNGSGRIYKTADGGTSWAKLVDQPGTYFRCIAFADSLRGFVGNIGQGYFPGVTDSTVLYTTRDGGTTWQPVPAAAIEGPLPIGLCAIQVIDSLHIVAGGRVGSPAHFMRSSDGGVTWQSFLLDDNIDMVTDLYFSSRDTGYLFGGTNANIQLSKARVLRTTDGGATWEVVFTGTHVFELCWKASFPDARTGYATLLSYAPNNPDRYFAKSIDGGLTWQELPLSKNGEKTFGIAFLDSETGWIGADFGGWQTVDGGATWTSVDLGRYANKIRLVKNSVGFAIGLRIFKMQIGN